MTLKEIAKLANVSPSTVSKIANGKHESISDKTVQKVKQLIKQHHYVPYGSIVPSKANQRTFRLGIVLKSLYHSPIFLSHVLETAQSHGYSCIISTPSTNEQFTQSLHSMLYSGVDGILVEHEEALDAQSASLLDKCLIPWQTVGEIPLGNETDRICFDYESIGFQGMEKLIHHQHKDILCLLSEKESKGEQFFNGCQRALFTNDMPSSCLSLTILSQESEAIVIPNDISALLCFGKNAKDTVVKLAKRQGITIPKHLSLLTVSEQQDTPYSSFTLAYDQLATVSCAQLIAKIEDPSPIEKQQCHYATYNDDRSLNAPTRQQSKKFVVVGTLNIDSLITMQEFPRSGETLRATGRLSMPSGKGLNQAITLAGMGEEVGLIGKIGCDHGGKRLYEHIAQHQIATHGLFTTADIASGHAYVYIKEDGESGIVIYDGANSTLTIDELEQCVNLFKGASYCLLQTEMPMEIVLHAAKLAKAHGCKVILKPCTVHHLPDALLSLVDLLVPNEKELHALLPFDAPLQEKMKTFVEKGVDTVIVTTGNKGGYYQTTTGTGQFDALKVQPVDTTGAADSFCATLCVYLAHGYSLNDSIQYATVAAGHSTLHYGIATSPVYDKKMLDFLLHKGEKTLEMDDMM